MSENITTIPMTVRQPVPSCRSRLFMVQGPFAQKDQLAQQFQRYSEGCNSIPLLDSVFVKLLSPANQ